MTLIVLCGGPYFAYDGWIGWPAQNYAEMERSRPKDAQGELVVDPRITSELAGKGLAELREQFDEPPLRTPTEWRYYGVNGYLVIRSDTRRRADWISLNKHSVIDLLLQKVIGVALMLVAVVLVIRFVRILRTRVVLDDKGLHLKGGRVIAWDDMTALETKQFRQKGWLDLAYASDGRSNRFRIDSYHLREFDALVDEICRRKSFPNPLDAKRTTGPAASSPQA
ncbi:MAG: hypothetical protein V3T70_01240 [Phycisphaerae bacterium]